MITVSAVFDCMVYLQAAARATGPARACLRLVQQRRVLLVISPPIFAELEDVLNRPKVRQKFRSLDSESVAVFLADIKHLATSILDVPQVVSLTRDPKDEPYVNLALKAGSKYLVTWDKDLLSLVGDEPKAIDFKTRFPDLTILTPVAFLREFASEGAP